MEEAKSHVDGYFCISQIQERCPRHLLNPCGRQRVREKSFTFSTCWGQRNHSPWLVPWLNVCWGRGEGVWSRNGMCGLEPRRPGDEQEDKSRSRVLGGHHLCSQHPLSHFPWKGCFSGQCPFFSGCCVALPIQHFFVLFWPSLAPAEQTWAHRPPFPEQALQTPECNFLFNTPAASGRSMRNNTSPLKCLYLPPPV